jgi:hypothetical protein
MRRPFRLTAGIIALAALAACSSPGTTPAKSHLTVQQSLVAVTSPRHACDLLVKARNRYGADSTEAQTEAFTALGDLGAQPRGTTAWKTALRVIGHPLDARHIATLVNACHRIFAARSLSRS